MTKLSAMSKRSWVNAYLKADDRIVEGFTLYPKELKSDFENELKRFVLNVYVYVFNVYVPKSNVVSLKNVRWIRFKMNSSNISLLPPSPGVFHQHILRSYWLAPI